MTKMTSAPTEKPERVFSREELAVRATYFRLLDEGREPPTAALLTVAVSIQELMTLMRPE